jgi:hypothetical protein
VARREWVGRESGIRAETVAAEPAWPPGPSAQARIDELRRVIGDPTTGRFVPR